MNFSRLRKDSIKVYKIITDIHRIDRQNLFPSMEMSNDHYSSQLFSMVVHQNQNKTVKKALLILCLIYLELFLEFGFAIKFNRCSDHLSDDTMFGLGVVGFRLGVKVE